MINRLQRKLDELFAAGRSEQERRLAVAELEQRYSDSESVKVRRPSLRYVDAMVEGWRAGERTNVRAGVGGGHTPELLGR